MEEKRISYIEDFTGFTLNDFEIKYVNELYENLKNNESYLFENRELHEQSGDYRGGLIRYACCLFELQYN